MTVRHRLAALSSLFEHLCKRNAATHYPVKGVKRPSVESYAGKKPALGDHQARALLDAPYWRACATAATNALDHQADIAKLQEWLGHANIATTRIYDHRKTTSQDSLTFKVAQ